MMRRAIGIALMGAALAGAAPVKLAPADDPVKPVGAAARAKQGPEPLAKPPEDIGGAEDPPLANTAGPVPPPPAPATPAPNPQPK